MTILFKNLPQKYPDKAILVPNIGNYVFSWNFTIH